jgi:alpha-ketoglutarate-dependent taurine dioxygenase
MSSITINRLAGPVGAEVADVDVARLRDDDDLPAVIREALENVGVLVFRELHLDPALQVAFCRKLGPIDTRVTTSHPVEGITRVTLDRSKSELADYLRANFGWHIDGCTPYGEESPPMVTMLTAQTVADGGDTEFASTYACYDELTDDEKALFATLRVLHSFEAAVLPFLDAPTPEHLTRLRAQPTKVHPLVWTHDSGRRSLVIGTHAHHVEGMPLEQGRALLADLLARATNEGAIYRHHWSAGDTVLWDNRGLLHRVTRYDTGKPREMLRTTVLGQEQIR